MSLHPSAVLYAELYLERCKQIQRQANSEPIYQSTMVQLNQKQTVIELVDDEPNICENLVTDPPIIDLDKCTEMTEPNDLQLTGVEILKEWIDISELDTKYLNLEIQKDQNSTTSTVCSISNSQKPEIYDTQNDIELKILKPQDLNKSDEEVTRKRKNESPVARSSEEEAEPLGENWADLDVEEEAEEDSNEKFQCDHCSYKTNWKGNMTKHVISRHQSNEEIQWFECAHCSYKGKTREYLRTHLRQAHVQFATWFRCELCPYICKAKQFLKLHVTAMHTAPADIRWFECGHCGFKSKFKTGLKAHVKNKHLGESEIRWYRCNHCTYKGKTKKGLRKHVINKHTDNEQIEWFQCDKCEYRAKDNKLLRRHINYHHPIDGEPKKARVEQDEVLNRELLCRMCGFKSDSRREFHRHFIFDGNSYYC